MSLHPVITPTQLQALTLVIDAYCKRVLKDRWPSWHEMMDVWVYNRKQRRIPVATLDVLERFGLIKTKRTECSRFVPRNGYSHWDGGYMDYWTAIQVVPTRKGHAAMRRESHC